MNQSAPDQPAGASASSRAGAGAARSAADRAADGAARGAADGAARGAADRAADGAGGESNATVLLALAANLGVGLLKLVAGLLSGSGALLSEAAHSVGDSSTEVLLLTALRRSDRPADRVHPFGYGKERYFWSLLAAVTILVSGAAFSIFQGVHTLLSGHEGTGRLWINYPVLAVAFVLEAISFRQALGQARGAARRGRRSVRAYIRNPEDPTVKSVVLEDSAALVGLVIAAGGVGLHQLTGKEAFDGAASVLIGVLLVGVAFALAQTCKELLIGRQADLALVRAISQRLEEQPEIIDVVDLLTMMVGTGRILLCTRVDFVDTYSVAEVESACVRIDGQLRDEFDALDEIFIQPVPRTDAGLRERVLHRYGRVLAEEEPASGEERERP
ncbi:cation diffusion facilitator family transporter [Jatrophihabitans telluris]|uniref:Cation diffusion facilitator family transporter n=1 Tax=Jatrophihabitans telluris TaxID=2038343 RepID=A0ABY4QVL7_9ACTN|nr:cation diffusion facilitator family transporter [Jatrophihabitans telluris]UQX87329.1 cation diffusion facilitator family transporter [Jatrophihabitans telluris]